ncbi:trafficking protein particle complex subunit 8-like [Rhagoletis pomonella]|uniref:trafficking protein particle complex subunit 8-like n=1 Tax=Rhagoletis pomonella TaxID=28610 RepID=UPI0017830328|nr:trafficking protein particle complex subunit 8-like [Rhagoletis pomonella]
MIHLTGHNYNAREIIQNIFSPLVGVTCSPLANDVCARNHLSFVEMLQPFSKLLNDAHFRDVSETSVSIKGLRLNFCDIDWRPPQMVLARKMLNEAVTNAHNEKTKYVTIGNMDLQLPTSEPWFEQWRETFLTVQFPADHEFTRHFISCLIVLSSSDPNIVESAQKLTQRVHQMQSVTPQKLPKWFHSTNVLNSYVVLHEGSQGDISKAQQGYELLKSTFGNSKCFLVQINSLDATVSGEVSDYWVPYIKRQPKNELQVEQLSGPKTPQDAMSMISMPNIQMSILSDAMAPTDSVTDVTIIHPLSPVQENATEAISSKFSVSSESIASQTINANVWASETDGDNTTIHGGCMNSMDVENLRHFVQDYTVRALIPYAEQLVALLVEAITNKKGVSKSLLSATKRWFVSSKPGSNSVNQNAVIYTNESSELQTRKLGDLYFIFGHYNLAFQAYHQAKRDFNADSAWQYYAGALEMAAVSAFMLGTANRKTFDYMEDAIMCYLTVCKLQQFATRATLLSMECLRTSRMYGEAAKQLIRMTSEDADLRSALLLEQAAYCFLASNPSMYRKYAFNIVLSGNRYSRAGQRKHAHRCYQQAFQVFQSRGWSLAEDHIQYTMAKQACALKRLEEASRSYSHLLHPGSQQSAQQQVIFLKEYIQMHTELIKRNPELGLLSLALPQVTQNSIRVLLSTPTTMGSGQQVAASGIDIKSNSADESVWGKMEEMLVATADPKKAFVFKPTRFLFSKECPAIDNPLAVQGEPIEISVNIFNTVKCSITLNGIDLLWKLQLDNGEVLSNESLYSHNEESSSKAAVSAAIKTSCVPSVVLDERCDHTIYFKITPKLTGLLNIIGVVGEVVLTSEPTACLLGMLQFDTPQVKVKGKQSTQMIIDNKLSIKVTPSVPAMSVSFSQLPTNLVAGEILPVTVTLRNSGIVPIEDVYLCCDQPRRLTLMDGDLEVPLSILKTVKDLTNEKLSKDREIRRQRVFRLLKHENSVSLKPQACATIPMHIQAPYEKGEFTLRLLFIYILPDGTSATIKYRLVRHNWKFQVHECLHSAVTCVISNTLSGELGLDVAIKNESNAKIFTKSDMYINSLGIYSADHNINRNKLYITNQMEIATGSDGARYLSMGKSMNFQCRLERNTHNLASAPSKILYERVSFVSVIPSINADKAHAYIPSVHEMYGFLAKHETLYFNISINTDEFNSAVINSDPHTTVILNWAAHVKLGGDKEEAQRLAAGQHFIQLRNLYETTTSLGVQASHAYVEIIAKPQQVRSIAEFALNDTDAQSFAVFADEQRWMDDEDDDNVGDDDDVSFWEVNTDYVGKRCLLLDESFPLAVKG